MAWQDGTTVHKTGFSFRLPIEERLRINAFTGNVESKNVLVPSPGFIKTYIRYDWSVTYPRSAGFLLLFASFEFCSGDEDGVGT